MSFYNLIYGWCIVHKGDEGLYLVEVTNNDYRFIVCSTIMEDGAMLNQHFFKTLEEANDYYMHTKYPDFKVMK